MTTKKEIIIDLTLPGDAQALIKEQIIQQEAMETFFRLVQNSVNKVDSFIDTLKKHSSQPLAHHHDTIMISGPRGSGKTTFILSILHIIKQEKEYVHIEPLNIIDPTLLDRKGYAFSHIISLICNKVNQYIKQPELTKTCISEKRESREFSQRGEYRDWKSAFTRLAQGLSAMDMNEQQLDQFQTQNALDPLQNMEKAIKDAQSSIDLTYDFYCFVHLSLKLIGKKAFIIAFDDIDTHCKSGWPLLEVIRKYLTTPQIISIISGDINLYSIMVRQEQLKNFNSELIKFDCADACPKEQNKTGHKYVEILNNLEKEYVLKVLKPERRIDLKTLKESLIFFLIKIYFGKEKLTIQEYLKNLFVEVFYINNNNDQKSFQNHFFKESVRLNLNLLRISTEFLNNPADEVNLVTFHNRLIDLFFVPLYQGGFKPHDLKNPDHKKLLEILVLGLIQNNTLTRGIRLKPDFNDPDTDSQMIAIGVILAHLMKHHPELYFEYFIKVGLTQAINSMLSEEKNTPFNIHDYVKYIGIEHREFTINIARSAMIYIYLILSKKTVQKGIVSLMLPSRGKKGQKLIWNTKNIKQLTNLYEIPFGLPLADLTNWITNSCTQKHAKSFFIKITSRDSKLIDNKAAYFNRIDDLYEGIDSWHKYFVYCPLTTSKDRNDSRIALFSVFPLIATIGAFVYFSDTPASENNEHFSLLTTAKWISSIINIAPPTTLESAKSYGTEIEESESESDTKTESETESESDVTSHQDDSEGKIFFDALKKWCSQPIVKGVPVMLLARSWIRFLQSLDNQEDRFKSEDLYLGNILHRQIIAFLNSILIEEAISYSINLDFDNAITSDYNFYKNIRMILSQPKKYTHELKGKVPFFYWLASCPLWGLYINPDYDPEQINIFDIIINENDIELKHFKPSYHGEACFDNLFDPLNSVLINIKRGPKNYPSTDPPSQDVPTPSKPTQPQNITLSDIQTAASSLQPGQASKRPNASSILTAEDREYLDTCIINQLLKTPLTTLESNNSLKSIANDIAIQFLQVMRNYVRLPKDNAIKRAAIAYIIKNIGLRG
ncbi:MAG: KAP family NTPase [Magnetococcus sp. YQC-5]